ncbi:MAG: YlmC/YmxH family sporulation protein [Ruminococcus sp.]|jgi:YlmC/YmxH family sporulation protein|nr:YlmC/YmxH family sporulation protein [Ruminococcus sp.]
MLFDMSRLKEKEIINITDGSKIGYPDDVEVEQIAPGEFVVTKIVVYGQPKFFGIFGREADTNINSNDIELIGRDTILVKSSSELPTVSSFLTNLYEKPYEILYK